MKIRESSSVGRRSIAGGLLLTSSSILRFLCLDRLAVCFNRLASVQESSEKISFVVFEEV